VNFHRANLLTDSDRRKYRELFAKLISENELPSLPLLHRPKPKPLPNQLPISMPTNLSALIPPPAETRTTHQNDVTNNNENDQSNKNSSSTSNSSNLPLNFNEVTITFPGPQLPSLPPNNRTVKATLARQVTNVIKRHNGSLLTDKII
jgi:hypothetical protein